MFRVPRDHASNNMTLELEGKDGPLVARDLSFSTYIHTFITFITLHCIALHYITLHYITTYIHYIALHYTTLHRIALHYIPVVPHKAVAEVSE